MGEDVPLWVVDGGVDGASGRSGFGVGGAVEIDLDSFSQTAGASHPGRRHWNGQGDRLARRGDRPRFGWR